MTEPVSNSVGSFAKNSAVFVSLLGFNDVVNILDKLVRFLGIIMEAMFNHKICCLWVVVNPIQTGLFFASQDRGGLRRPYPCNCTTAYGMATNFSHNDILIISIT